MSSGKWGNPVARWGATYTNFPGQWVAEARCAEVDPEIFFPERGSSNKAAKKVCAACPVIEECKTYAVTSPIPVSGIWGGTSDVDRKQLRRDLGIVADRIKHGTTAGARAHWRKGEKPCPACHQADLAHSRLRREQRAER